MSNTVVCAVCDARLKVPEGYQGKSLRCPKCAASVSLLAPVPSPRPAKAVEVIEEEDFEEEVRPKKKMGRERARTWVMGPAICVITIGGLGSAFAVLGLLFYIINVLRIMGEPGLRIDFGGFLIGLIVLAVAIGFSAFLTFAGTQMVRLQNYAASMAGCILLILSSFCTFASTVVGTSSLMAHAPRGMGIAAGLHGMVAIVISGVLLVVGVAGVIILAREDVRRCYS